MDSQNNLVADFDAAFAQINDTHQAVLNQWPREFIQQLKIVVAYSQFVTDAFNRDQQLCETLPQMLVDEQRCDHYRERLAALLESCENEQQGYRLLRQFRRREMVYIAWRDITKSWELEQSLHHLSMLAEAMIFETYSWQYNLCTSEWGTPCDSMGQAQPMLIIGMGKLGGGELNFSSDIDLIFTYPENGETQGARRSIANSQFFTRLGQRVIKALDQQTVDGFCYRVDMRLRPFGESGPLVMSFSALEDYYQEQGRDWERYAMVKARVIGREMYPEYQRLRKMLRPFVFRRYIDFSAVQSLRKMKSMISSEVRRRGLSNNIKLGAGGIREIEFIVQVFQLIRGGREPSLRGRSLQKTLNAIGELKLLEAKEVTQLGEAYQFLRRQENLLQAMADKQTQTLPDDVNEQQKLAYVMGFSDWQQMLNATDQHMETVHAIFEQLVGETEEESCSVDNSFVELWNMAGKQQVVEHILSDDLNCEYANDAATTITRFHQDLAKKTIGPRGREVLDRLMPKLFQSLFDNPDRRFGLPRVLNLLQKIASRTTYLELLDEHPAALIQLIHLCTASPMVAEQLSRYPILLDELLDPKQLYSPIPQESYHLELRDFLARIPEDDMEQQMEALRQFKQISILRIAAADIANAMPITKVSDHLTYLAEAIVEAVINQAWLQLTAKYGEPSHLKDRQGKGFAVVGYGKVGGWELGYNSDLDIVFVHDCPANVYTNGKKEIDGGQFYLRLAQRIIHIFSTFTASGTLYEIDTRLRPSGISGLLACPIEAFAKYQHEEAWTWEHQALVRARMIYGDQPLQNEFNQVRQSVLCRQREQDTLTEQVVSMRKKMRDHLGGKKPDRFMLKQDSGGITDIEFLAQYLVLRFSSKYSELTRWSDNIRIFESLANQGIIKSSEAEELNSVYTALRDEIHRRNLLNLDADVDDTRFTKERQLVQKIWRYWFESNN